MNPNIVRYLANAGTFPISQSTSTSFNWLNVKIYYYANNTDQCPRNL